MNVACFNTKLLFPRGFFFHPDRTFGNVRARKTVSIDTFELHEFRPNFKMSDQDVSFVLAEADIRL